MKSLSVGQSLAIPTILASDFLPGFLTWLGSLDVQEKLQLWPETSGNFKNLEHTAWCQCS